MVQNMAGCGGGIRLGNSVEDQTIHNVTIWGQRYKYFLIMFRFSRFLFRLGFGVQFSDHCEVCYACLHNCPMNAIHMPDERSSAPFRNEHVLLKDIITANEL